MDNSIKPMTFDLKDLEGKAKNGDKLACYILGRSYDSEENGAEQSYEKAMYWYEKGKELASMQFSAYIERKTHTVPKRLVFVVGGPYGFSDAVYKAAAEKISLSKMTFSHQMIRLIFIEQIYRAMTILNNEPYHHE